MPEGSGSETALGALCFPGLATLTDLSPGTRTKGRAEDCQKVEVGGGFRTGKKSQLLVDSWVNESNHLPMKVKSQPTTL